MKLYEAIANNQHLLDALAVPGSDQAMRPFAEDRAERILARLPKGSGFDNGTTIERVTDREIVLSTAFHHMDGHGSYCGWTEHKVRVTSSLICDIDVRVGGRNERGIKDYIRDVMRGLMMGEFSWINPAMPPRAGG